MGNKFNRTVLNPLVAAIRAASSRGVGLSGALLSLPGLALAGPTGENVVAGVATVNRPNASHTQITQGSEQAIVNWHSFSVGGEEYVQFIQPNAQSAILNRVVGGSGSEILGRIDANGRVFLVNPQGVYFGRGMQVNAAGFAASALDIDDADFMAGRYVFTKRDGVTGAVVNEGEINADQFVVLMGERVDNEGLIEARLGTVVLASGSATTLQLDADGLVNFAVDEAAVTAAAGVKNAGEIVADGGRVLMTAKVAEALVATAVNNEGLIRAQSLSESNGEIYLRASGGDIVNRGTLDVAGIDGQAGGAIIVKGNKNVDLEAGRVNADGDGAGDGGSVRLVAGEKLHVREDAQVTVRGGASGQGGALELSATSGMTLDGDIALGDGGQVVLDPARVQLLNDASVPAISAVVTVGRGFIESQLNANTNVTIVASDEIFAVTPMTINATGTGNLALKIGTLSYAGSSLGSLPGAGCLSTGVCEGALGSFGFAADPAGDINLAGVNINITGRFLAVAGDLTGGIELGNISALDVELEAETGDITVGNVVAMSSLSIDVFTDGDIKVGNINAGDELSIDTGIGDITIGNITAGSSVSISADVGNITIGNINAVDSVELFNGDGNITVGNIISGDSVSINASSGNITVGNITAGSSVDISAHGGNIVVGNIVTSGEGDVTIDAERFEGVGGNITVGNITATSSVDIEASSGNIKTGNIIAEDSVTLRTVEFGNITVGNITAGSDVSISAETAGNITVGNISAIGHSVDVFANDGNITLGDVSAGGVEDDIDIVADGLGNNITVGNINAGTDVSISANDGGNIVLGNINASRDVDVFVDGVGSITIGNINAGLSIEIGLVSGNIVVGNLVTTDSISIFNENGAIRTIGDGRLAGGEISLEGGSGGHLDIDVKTHSAAIMVGYYGPAGGGNVAIDNSTFNAPATIEFSTGLIAASMSGADIPFNHVTMKMGGDTDVAGSLAAHSLFVDVNGGGIVFRDTVTVGSGALPEEWGDADAIRALQQGPAYADGRPIGTPMLDGVDTVAPNAVFRGERYVDFLNGLVLHDPDTPYVIFATDGHVEQVGGVYNTHPTGSGDIVAQFTTYSPDRDIHIEATRTESLPHSATDPDPGYATFFNDSNFGQVRGTSIIVGNGFLPSGPHTGQRVVGPGIDLTNGGEDPFRNFVCIGSGNCLGIENVRGHYVIDIDLFAQSAFDTVTVNELLEDKDNEDEEVLLGEDDLTEDELLDTTDSDDESKGQVCSN
jgi:filamentous hemagglutinin family protein